MIVKEREIPYELKGQHINNKTDMLASSLSLSLFWPALED